MLRKLVLVLSGLLCFGCYAQTHFSRSHHLMNINKCKSMPAYNSHVHFHCEKNHHHSHEKENKSAVVSIPKVVHTPDTTNHVALSASKPIITKKIVKDTVKVTPKPEPIPDPKPEVKFLSKKTVDSLSKLNDENKTKGLDKLKPAVKFPPINFLHDQDEFSVANMDSFMEAAEFAKQGHLVLVDGHTDDKGSDEYNQKLSLKRALKIKQLMIDFGVKPEFIAIKGSGEKNPLVPNDTDENRNKNRRIEFTVY